MSYDLGKLIFEKLNELKEENGGSIDVNNIDHIVDKFTEIIKSQVSSDNDLAIYSQIEKISKQIKETKTEVSSVDTHKMHKDFPDATDQLYSITEATEKSTNIILTKAEELMKVASSIADPEIKKQINQISTEIMEACNFQDLTGQRISKVITTLSEVETIVTKLLSTFKPNKKEVIKKEQEKPQDSHLLNGPQAEHKAPSQQEIDDLFNNM